jgi:integrase
MPKHNAANERIKREYFRLLKEARGYDEQSIDAVAASIDRFETYTKRKAFDRFHIEQAIGFKRWLEVQNSQRTGRPLAKSTMSSTLRALREFFLWMSGQPGFRSRISFGDTAYFRMTEKDERAAARQPDAPVPSIRQIRRAIETMPALTVFQRRDRAVMAFVILTGARDNAVASLRIRHVDLVRRLVFQDPRDVRTKASKAIRTWFFPVGEPAEELVSDWIQELRGMDWAEDDPLFPATLVRQNESRLFTATGLRRENWSNADPIRKIFRSAFEAVGLPYFNPHSFRKTLAQLGERLCRSPEEFKAWSQNLGHEQVLTTFSSYGSVAAHRQGEIILQLGQTESEPRADLARLLVRAAEQLASRAL